MTASPLVSSHDLAQRMQRIRTKLDALRARDGARRVFGAKNPTHKPGWGHDYVEEPALAAGAIAALEADGGDITLPAELQAFLTMVHSGGAGPGYGLDVRAHAGAARPFEISRAMSDTAGTAWIDTETGDDEFDDWPPGMGFVWLAHWGCGVFDVLVVTGDLRGTAWVYDMRWNAYRDAAGAHIGFADWYERWLDRQHQWLDVNPSAPVL